MMQPIALIRTPFGEKFGVPRQPLLIREAWGKLSFPKTDFYSEAFRGLEDFSHLWLIFEFHHIEDKDYGALVRPPRFFGKKKLGVFATRSPHRPNRLGLSVVEFDRIEVLASEIVLWVRGVDLLDGTPVYDIKPYVPYCDSIAAATASYFERPEILAVTWECECRLDPQTRALLEKVIGIDPRPGQDHGSAEEYGVSVAGWNARFKKIGDAFVITKVARRPS